MNLSTRFPKITSLESTSHFHLFLSLSPLSLSSLRAFSSLSSMADTTTATTSATPAAINNAKESPLSMAAVTPLISPCSDKRLWSALHNRVEALLESKTSSLNDDRGSNRAKRMKEDSQLLIRGFDSVAYSLSQLTGTLENALQGVRDLAKPPTLTEIVQRSMINTEKEEDGKQDEESDKAEEGNRGERNRLKKRKLSDARQCSNNNHGGVGEAPSDKEKEQKHQRENQHLLKVKNLAVLMAAKSTSLGKELKSMKSELSFMQERCILLEEENRRLRDGFGKGIRPEEDDLVRLQLEALLAEKSRLATENANLTRENQCLRQLVEYHQFTSQDLSASYEDLSASYEEVIQGLCLDFSSPIAEEPQTPRASSPIAKDPQTPRTAGSFELQTSLDESFHAEEKGSLLKD